MRKAVDKVKALLRGAASGLGAPADTFRVNRYDYPHRSEQEAMRSDWRRVGDDIRVVIKRNDGKAAA